MTFSACAISYPASILGSSAITCAFDLACVCVASRHSGGNGRGVKSGYPSEGSLLGAYVKGLSGAVVLWFCDGTLASLSGGFDLVMALYHPHPTLKLHPVMAPYDPHPNRKLHQNCHGPLEIACCCENGLETCGISDVHQCRPFRPAGLGHGPFCSDLANGLCA